MRLAERLARLERVQDTDPRMSADEIDAAAARYGAELVADGTPCGRPLAAALEAIPSPTKGRRLLLMPWEPIPEHQDGDMIGLYNLVAVTPEGPQRVEYKRNGIHPRDDAPGSWNRHLYYGEPLHA